MNNTLTLLGLLSRQPSYGYDLKHSYDCYFGTEKQLAFGQVYSTLARMIRDELIRALGEEAGGGPDRKKYEITVAGQDKVREWLFTPDAPSEALQSNLFAKTVIALLTDDAERLLDLQRAEHMSRMRELTRLKQDAELLQVLMCGREKHRDRQAQSAGTYGPRLRAGPDSRSGPRDGGERPGPVCGDETSQLVHGGDGTGD